VFGSLASSSITYHQVLPDYELHLKFNTMNLTIGRAYGDEWGMNKERIRICDQVTAQNLDLSHLNVNRMALINVP